MYYTEDDIPVRTLYIPNISIYVSCKGQFDPIYRYATITKKMKYFFLITKQIR